MSTAPPDCSSLLFLQQLWCWSSLPAAGRDLGRSEQSLGVHRSGWVILQPGVSGSGAAGVAAEPLDSAGAVSGTVAMPVPCV